MPSLAKASFAEIQRIQKSISERQKQVVEQVAMRVANDLRATLARFGMTLEEVFPYLQKHALPGNSRSVEGAKPSTLKHKVAMKPLPAKFANPSDPKATWSGHGKQPMWFKEAVAAGKDPSTLLIKSASTPAQPKKTKAPAKKKKAAKKPIAKKKRAAIKKAG